MRFDYFGTGDSDGGLEAASVSRWIDDVGAADDELLNISGCTQRSLIGLRLGSALAFLHAQQSTTQWQSLTFWEPVVNGAQYLAEFGNTPQEPVTSIMGFPLHAELHQELSTLQLKPINTENIETINSVTSSTSAEQQQFFHSLQSSNTVTESVIPIAGDWAKTDEFLSAMLPREMIMRIVSSFTGASA